nr:MAG TPA: hypothetical protein [Caudoviricetes sp.]
MCAEVPRTGVVLWQREKCAKVPRFRRRLRKVPRSGAGRRYRRATKASSRSSSVSPRT